MKHLLIIVIGILGISCSINIPEVYPDAYTFTVTVQPGAVLGVMSLQAGGREVVQSQEPGVYKIGSDSVGLLVIALYEEGSAWVAIQYELADTDTGAILAEGTLGVMTAIPIPKPEE